MKKTFQILGALAIVVAMFFGGYYYNSVKPNVSLGYRENTGETEVITNATATSTGATVSVVYYRNLGVTVASEAASGTVRLACSLQDTAPDFYATKSASNAWDYVQMIDTEDGSEIDGDTGVVLTTTEVRQFEANSNNFRWCTALLEDTVTGTTTVRFKPADNS